MGFEDACFEDSEDDMIRALLSSGHPFLEGITLEQLDREHSVRLNVSAEGDAVSAVRGRKIRNSVGQVRTGCAGVCASGGIAVR